MANKTAARRAAQGQRQAALRKAAASARRRQLLLRGGVVVLVIAIVAIAALAAFSGGGGSDSSSSSGSNPTPTGSVPTLALNGTGTALASGQPLQVAAPPWSLPADARPYIAAAGLTALPSETLTVHYHAHVDIIDDGRAVTVPQGLGFVVVNGAPQGLTSLHTHDTSGIVHIESPDNTKFTLGQVMVEWGVRLSSQCIGGLCSGNGKTLRFFVDGRPYTGNPQDLVLRGHQEISIWFGPATSSPTVPSSYDFPEGY